MNPNIEQIEAELAALEFNRTRVAVVLPIRGTIITTTFGILRVESSLEDENSPFHVYHVVPGLDLPSLTNVAFCAHDVKTIAPRNDIDGGKWILILLKTEQENDEYYKSLIKHIS